MSPQTDKLSIGTAWSPNSRSQVLFLGCPVREALMTGTRGGGKGLPLYEPVLTPQGWRAIGDLAPGDLILAPSGDPVRVTGVFPQGMRPTYRLTFEDGATSVCDDVHLWQVRLPRASNRDWRVLPVQEVERLVKDRNKSVQIPLVQDASVDLGGERPLDPYVLGLILGDGGFTKGQGLRYCTVDDELAQAVLTAGFREHAPDPRTGVRLFRGPASWLSWLRTNIDPLKKSVPASYKWAPREVRLAILQGLMDTDGHKGGEFASKSRLLAEDVQWLVRSLGGRCSLAEKVVNRQLYWRVRAVARFEMFRLSRKVGRIHQHPNLYRRITKVDRLPPQETVCISVEGKLFVTRDFVVTHNTDTLLMTFAMHVNQGHGPAWRGVLFRKTYKQLGDVIAKSKKWFRQFFPAAKFNAQATTWTFPDGEELLLRRGDKPDDYWDYHGHEYPWIAFEELTNWADPAFFLRMQSCNRSSTTGMPRMVRSTCNPYGVGHNWVKARYGLPGKMGKIVETAGEHPRVAINSHFTDNVTMMMADPDYRTTIISAARNDSERKAWLYGDWEIVAGGMFDDVFDASHHVLARMAPPLSRCKLDRAYDHGSSRPFALGWWWQVTQSFEAECNRGSKLLIPGDLVLFSEWYGWNQTPNEGLRLTATNVAKGIKEREQHMGIWQRVMAGPADTQIFESEPGEPTVASTHAAQGVQWMRADKGRFSRRLGWEAMRDRLEAGAEEERTRPGLFIQEQCEQWRRTVVALPRADDDLDDVDTEAEDHMGDMSRYRVRKRALQPQQGSF